MDYPLAEMSAVVATSEVTVLTARTQKTVKSYSIDTEGALQCIPYAQEYLFDIKKRPISNIVELGTLVQELSSTDNTILIRGEARTGITSPARRQKENFPEANSGCHWLMLDFDDLPVPDGVDRLSIEAIESAIQKLPVEFHSATYYYQFSASAGICRPDGSPLKSGLNVHIFYFLEKPVHGRSLAAHLTLHCLKSGFYERTTDRSGHPIIKLGVDPAVLRSSVQPHYVGLPNITSDVTCTLKLEQRQGLVKKQSQTVQLNPVPDIVRLAGVERKRNLDLYKRECGFTPAVTLSRALDGGIAATTYFKKTDRSAPSKARVFLEARPYNDNAMILYFEGESSPGSWFVQKNSPTVARKFGEGEQVPLKELSEGAFAYFKDELRWFSEASINDALPLTQQGFLPEIHTFATARNSLIIAPTGSGKTTAFARFVQGQVNKVIFYAAQTIALVSQMQEDLSARGVLVNHYQDFHPSDQLEPGVYVTTNESLRKLVQRAITLGRNYILVIDEAHAALDDFLVSSDKNTVINTALSRAERTYLMTATLTNLQIATWTELISRAHGELHPEVFGMYTFAPVKRSPLVVKPVANFGADFVALLRRYQGLAHSGELIPRTIIITPTGRMRHFTLLLDNFGLTDLAHVVSRPESTRSDIERARISARPILISSPLFALGLNFEVQPERFWTFFSSLQVDTSQIVQTLNRANRGSVNCEVRLYHGNLDDRPIWLPKRHEEAARIRGILAEETSVEGLLDAHLHIDRNVYKTFRKLEKKTSKSLATLINNDAIQNYVIDPNWVETLDVQRSDAELFKGTRTIARTSYADEVRILASSLKNEPVPLLLARIQNLKDLKLNLPAETVERELEIKEQATLAALCQATDPAQGKHIRANRILRMHSEIPPFLTGQYGGVLAQQWRGAAAEKATHILSIMEALPKLRSGEIDGLQFAHAMRRGLREGVLALADSETDLLHKWHPALKELDELALESKEKASAARRERIRREQFGIAADFLQSIGIFFGKHEGSDLIDPTKPHVPDWDFERMAANLKLSARSMLKSPETKPDSVHQAWADPPICRSVCEGCVHKSEHWSCAIGRPIHWPENDVVVSSKSCDAKVDIPKRLRAALQTSPKAQEMT